MEALHSSNNGPLVEFLEKENRYHINPAITLSLFVTRFEIFYIGFQYVFRLISLVNIELEAMFLGYMSCMRTTSEFCSIHQGPRTHNFRLKEWIEPKLPYPFWCCLDADQAETKGPKEQDMGWLGEYGVYVSLPLGLDAPQRTSHISQCWKESVVLVTHHPLET
ncbi:hypothetical protein VNO77_03961 [Canavalia gladiata]|uniref:Uncharacterized protein n=1 Tax=Canavalia gladiata TaxID=3824 RepID=A0AAN9MWB4_CANGL